MAVSLHNLKVYGALDFADGFVGGAIMTFIKPIYTEVVIPGDIQVVSSNDVDDTGANGITIQIYTKEDGGTVPAQPLSGQTPVTFGLTSASIVRATMQGGHEGDIGLESVTASFTDTLDAGSDTDVTLPAGASAVDQFYRGMVIRETNGSKRIREIIDYNGTTKVAKVNRVWGGTAPSGTTTVRICQGLVFDRLPVKIEEIYLPFDVSAGGGAVLGTGGPFYTKVFIKNTHATDTLSGAQIAEVAGGLAGDCEFALATATNDSGTNGNTSNTVAPSSGVTAFDSSAKTIPGDTNLGPAEYIGVWLKFDPTATVTSFYSLELTGDTGAFTRGYDFPLLALGASVFDYTASGGIVMGGTAGHSSIQSYSGSGGVVMGGAAETSFSPSTQHNYTGSGGIVTGGAARTQGVPHTVGSGGVVVGGAAVVEATVTQISFDIFHALEAPLPVFFDILTDLTAPNGVVAEFDIYEGPNGVSASFSIFSERLRTARISEDVQQPVAKVEIN